MRAKIRCVSMPGFSTPFSGRPQKMTPEQRARWKIRNKENREKEQNIAYKMAHHRDYAYWSKRKNKQDTVEGYAKRKNSEECYNG